MKPDNRNLRLVAEWEPQSVVILVWPDESSDWRANLAEVRNCYLKMIAAIAPYQMVLVIVRNLEARYGFKKELRKSGLTSVNITISECAYDDTWIRDYGPLSTECGSKIRLVDNRFNAWGGKQACTNDDRISRELAQSDLFDCPLDASSLVLEGGAVETDGRGTLLATRGSVVTESRNPGVDSTMMESLLNNILGLSHFHWLESSALIGDDTDGHIDTLARFTDTRTITYSGAESASPDYRTLLELESELRSIRQPDGSPYRLIPLPPPGEHLSTDGRPLPATYANFLITNEAVLVPVYGVDNDHRAIETIRGCFPSRRVIPIDSRPLIEQNGSIHCATIQLAKNCFSRKSDEREL